MLYKYNSYALSKNIYNSAAFCYNRSHSDTSVPWQ